MTKQSFSTVIILSITSDIGHYLAHQYIARGWKVIGTYRNAKHLGDLRQIGNNCQLIKCDVTSKSDVAHLVAQLKVKGIRWDRFISCVGNLLPAQPFFEGKFDQWQESVEVNALGQLRVLHAIYPLRAKNARVVFFAGGGANQAVKDITAYAASKVMLTKMVEYLDAENKDLSLIIVGPGWTVTKIHEGILKTKTVAKTKLAQTKNDLKKKPSTPLADIDACIEWLCDQSKNLVSGRNFSVVFDPWREKKRQQLIKQLQKDVNMYKLRRDNNNFLQ